MPYFVPFNFTIAYDTGIEEGGTLESPEATVGFKVAWSDRINFMNFVCGTTLGGPGAIVRTLPAQYPPSPNMYATREFRIQPLGKLQTLNNWVTYPYALVSIKFAIPHYDFDGSTDASGKPWTTTSFDVGGEFLTLPDSAYKFTGGIPANGSVGKVIPQISITMKKHWMPYLPVAEMFNLVGTVNNAPVNLGNFVAPTETLLFLGGTNSREADTAGGVSQEVDYKMTYRPISWNKFLHPNGTSGFQYLFDGGGNKVYSLGDFTTLP